MSSIAEGIDATNSAGPRDGEPAIRSAKFLVPAGRNEPGAHPARERAGAFFDRATIPIVKANDGGDAGNGIASTLSTSK